MDPVPENLALRDARHRDRPSAARRANLVESAAQRLPRASRQRILICAPAHFEVSYAINPWMQGHLRATSAATAQHQWTLLREVLARHALIETVAPIDGLPDMPFTANAGLVRRNRFIPSRFRHAERRGEEAAFTRWFADAGFEVHALDPHIVFEGAGDALFDPALDALWIGHGQRSDRIAADAVGRVFGIETLPLRLVDPHYYHLDTCFCPLPDGMLLWHPPAFDTDSRRLVESRFAVTRRIAVDERDARLFSCNAIPLGSALVVHRASATLKQALDDVGFTVIETPLDEFHKAGGSARCLTLPLA